ncbi:hypothetical protein N5P37_005916 [Trichoderma harzianum]|uniref:Uncharacterized protein n=1 Tax=Trichoderma harzianum CBS 226.95 TaxID=983964 RepID=A0A2T4AB12_TRIHA|nr:hypothetical protein M431DRAFT_453772 [Trichoderma harzianum CBS 226.95]KAK0760975.1 hypothetical protein N5P37_005916 [Trichoderma harzianum]PKK45602.1 hypothetical protein CI102_10422 [Trichoderma harzianum]PTB54265.1 hypothetical protein M431DRAFT_453772 [Trichoderma harzianum CBS 226.95]
MGVDCGFDVHPTLGLECRDLYEAFLEEVVQKYKQTVHPNTGKPLVQIVGSPGTQNAYIYFNVGEGPILPYNIDYFTRFESGLVDDVMKYLKEVYMIARRYFPNNVQFWVSGASPSLIQVLDRIPNMRGEEGKPSTGDKWYKVRAELFRLSREQGQGINDREDVKDVDSPQAQ